MKKKSVYQILLITFFVFFTVFTLKSYSQTKAWNSGSFKFTKDTASLTDMTGATNIVFSGTLVLSSPSIGLGSFDFQFGLKKYSNFYVSPYGFIKLGNKIANNDPEQDTAVVVALFNKTNWGASYKISGNAPDRKMVVEFSGVMQPSGEPTKFQIWIHERNGRIQFVYQSLRGFYNYNSIYNYKIFCRTSIINQITSAALNVKPNNTIPNVSYISVPGSFDSIYANTKYTFQPDTIKPVSPSLLNFTNIQPGCLTVNFTDNSTNESLFLIEKADSTINFKSEKFLYTASPNGTSVQIYNQTNLQPFWNYNYRVFASNGFLNSDTVTASIQTPMPQISGIKKIPGDYPSVTALLLDASCKHIGPDLVIELQNNYSFSSETLPVVFGGKIQNRFINSITIRPALNANIIWAASTNRALFYVDSVKHVKIDGRPGGTGTSINFTINQQNPLGRILQYTNSADSGSIEFCKLILKSSTNNITTRAITITALDSTFSHTGNDVNSFKLSNCILTTDTFAISNILFIKAKDSAGCKGFVISNNQFSRFNQDAIYFENGGENSNIFGNTFYQPVAFTPVSFLPINTSSCIKLNKTEKVTIDNNFFGGSSPVWGQGSYRINMPFSSNTYAFIDYRNTSSLKTTLIKNNKFGNISSNDGGYVKMIYADGGNLTIDNNRFGTSDSLYSITSEGSFWCISLAGGTKSFTNNFFSGIHGQFQSTSGITSFNDSYFITCSSGHPDSCNFKSNDFGGSNNTEANTAKGRIIAIYGSGMISAVGNQFRGIYSKKNKVFGITFQSTNNGIDKLMADSNNFHHLKAASDVSALNAYLNSTTINRASYNNVYALYTTGEVNTGSGFRGNMYGIQMSVRNYPNPTPSQGQVQLFGNKLYSFAPINVGNNAIYSIVGIGGYAPRSEVYNNSIYFGRNVLGQSIDTLTSIYAINGANYIENNSIVIGGNGGNGLSSTGITTPDPGFVTNNIIQIDRMYTNPSTSQIFQRNTNSNIISAKNLWYSSSNPNVSTLLQNYKQTCSCDSSSFAGDPHFINPAGDSSNYNLHLSIGSMADSTGTPPVLNTSDDLDGQNRNSFSPTDIGCYVATPCTTVFPSINIIAPSSDSIQLCSPGTLTLTASITNGAFQQLQWQRNLNDIIGANSSILTVTTPGTYRLVGKLDCGKISSRNITVVNTVLEPAVTIKSSATNICIGTNVQFAATATNAGVNPVYQWQVNGLNAGTNSNNFSTTTIQNNDQVEVKMTVTTCTGTYIVTSNIITVLVNATPLANAGPDAGICNGSITIGTPAIGTSTYSWTSNPAGFTSTFANPVVTPVATTTYFLIVSNGNCVAKDTVVITAGTLTANAGNDKAICPGTTLSLGTLPSVSNTYSWISIPTGFSSSFSNPVVSPAITTSYILTVTSANCVAKDTVVVTVVPTPIANAGADRNICVGTTSTTVIGTSGITGNNYSWTPATGLSSSSIAQPTASPASTTTYTLAVTNIAGCKSTDTVIVNLIPGVVISLPDTAVTICAGNYTTIGIPFQSGYNYNWVSIPSGFSSTLANPAVSPLTTTQYLLTQTDTTTGCIGHAHVNVVVDSCTRGFVNLYPTPSNNFIIVQLDVNNAEPKYLNITDAMGKLIIKKALNYRTTIDISNIPSGIYFYTIKTGIGSELKSGKVIIQR